MPVHACFNTDFFVSHAAPGGGRRFMIEEVEDEEKKEEGVPMIHLACLYDTHSPRCGKVQSIQLHPAIANYFGLWLWIQSWSARTRDFPVERPPLDTPYSRNLDRSKPQFPDTRPLCLCLSCSIILSGYQVRGRLTVMLVRVASLRCFRFASSSV